MAMTRDAVAYALMPQATQGAKSVWDNAHVPYENREPDTSRNLEPTMFGGWTLPDRAISTPAIPRVYIDQPAESYDPDLEKR